MERRLNTQTDRMDDVDINRNRTLDDESAVRPVSNPGGEDGDEDYQDEEEDVVYNEDDLDDEVEPVAADLDDVETERDLDEDDLDDEDLVLDDDDEEEDEDRL